jgi:hypothetical protein
MIVEYVVVFYPPAALEQGEEEGLVILHRCPPQKKNRPGKLGQNFRHSTYKLHILEIILLSLHLHLLYAQC